jgi:hypothetical protein
MEVHARLGNWRTVCQSPSSSGIAGLIDVHGDVSLHILFTASLQREEIQAHAG